MRRFKMHVAEKHPDISEEDNCKIASLNKVKMHKVQGKLGNLQRKKIKQTMVLTKNIARINFFFIV